MEVLESGMLERLNIRKFHFDACGLDHTFDQWKWCGMVPTLGICEDTRHHVPPSEFACQNRSYTNLGN